MIAVCKCYTIDIYEVCRNDGPKLGVFEPHHKGGGPLLVIPGNGCSGLFRIVDLGIVFRNVPNREGENTVPDYSEDPNTPPSLFRASQAVEEPCCQRCGSSVSPVTSLSAVISESQGVWSWPSLQSGAAPGVEKFE